MKPFDLEFIEHSKLLCKSYQLHFNELLVKDEANCAFELYHADFVVVAHGTEHDPVFNYANITAQNLWQYDWDSFINIPSKLSAEDVNRASRSRMLHEVKTLGHSKNYEGVRIDKLGNRFVIQNVHVWNILDNQGVYRGQAASFKQWQFL